MYYIDWIKSNTPKINIADIGSTQWHFTTSGTVTSNYQDFTVEIPMAGTKRKDISVKIKDDYLFIEYKQRRLYAEDTVTEVKSYYVPRDRYDHEMIECKYRDGLLTVRVPARKTPKHELTIEVK